MGPHGHPFVQASDTKYDVLSTKNLPKSFSWVEEVHKKDPKAVIPIRNQEECGSCWAFTTTAALEFYNWQAGGDFLKLAPQQLLDCDRLPPAEADDDDEEESDDEEDGGNDGCEGGFVDLAFQYTSKHAVAQEVHYPYEYHNVKEKKIINDYECETNIKGSKVKTNPKVFRMQPKTVDQLKAALLKAPVAISVDSDSDQFNFHKGDKPIRSQECQGNLGHAVLAVGYGHYDDDRFPCDYVIIKNSYGDDWGDKGYGMISLSQRHRKSAVCGVLGEGFWAEVSKENAAKK